MMITRSNMPRAGILFNDGFGGGSTVTENLGYNTCRCQQPSLRNNCCVPTSRLFGHTKIESILSN